MNKRIAIGQVALGMYVHKLPGSWLDHPFWKRAFLVTEPEQLGRLRATGVSELWIDTSRGRDVVGEIVAPPEAMATPAVEAPSTPAAFADELVRAARIIGEARVAMEGLYGEVRLGRAIDAATCGALVAEIAGSVDRHRGALISLARLKTSDDYTYLHSVAVCALMVALSRQIGLSDDLTREAGLAGLVHDLGKARMPIEILNKKGALTPEEFRIMRGHPEAGHAMLLEARGLGDGPLDVCLHHHERFDGSGYPHGLASTGISQLARMGAVCDVYDAITSNRPYKTGWDPAGSIGRMAQWSRDGHFDDHLFQAFVRSIGIYPTGSLVRLSSERLAIVVEQSGRSLLMPTVKAFYAIDARARCTPESIDLAVPGCRERIVSRESPEAWGLGLTEDLWRTAAAK